MFEGCLGQNQLLVTWAKPKCGWVKLNLDGAFNVQDGNSGAGVPS